MKNILFDFGNVILDIDIPATTRAFRALMSGSEANFNKAAKQNAATHLFERYETGKLGEQAFFDELRLAADMSLTNNDLRNAWNAMLLKLPSHRLTLLQELRQKYRVFMLSNTNGTHIAWVHDYLKKEYNINDFETRFFDKVYYSHEIGCRKPDTIAFQYVLNDANIEAAETLFVDDVAENIATASTLGFQTIHHQYEQEDLVDALKHFHIII